jgi:anti-sigma-K factor RskA
VQHLDPDRLVLLALSEESNELNEADHLTRCAACRDDLEALRSVASMAAEAQDLTDLPPPPERVWQAIEAEITRPVAPVVELRPRKQWRRWLVPAMAAAAAAIVAVVVLRPAPEQVTARATLTPLPTVPAAAGGNVRVLSDGEMRIDVRNLPLTTGFHEVWLIDPDDLSRMVAIGNLSEASDVVLPVPPGTDLNRYRLVDISDEPHDGKPTHSGRSLLRGTLTY